MPATTFSEYCARIIAQQRRDTRSSIVSAVELAAGNLDLKGTGLRNLVEWMEGHSSELLRPLFDSGLDDAVRLLEGVDDHALAIETLMRQNRGHSMSASTLLRGLVEGVLAVCYLFDAGIPPARAAARLVAFRLDSMEGAIKTALQFGSEMPADELDRVRGAAQGFRDLIVEHGFVLIPDSRNPEYTSAVHLDGQKASLVINATDAMKIYMPDETFGWWVASGAVHSKGWFLPTYIDGLDGPALSTHEQAIITVTTSVLRTAEALTTVLGAHTGADTRTASARIFTRLKAVLAKGRDKDFSPIDIETYNSRGKQHGPRRKATVGPSFLKPGREYGTLDNY